MKQDNKRFEKVYSQESSALETTGIWMDSETGVNYLFPKKRFSGGLTVLLDKEGKPVVSPVGYK